MGGTQVVALIIFVASAALLFYVYVGYPLLITVWARQREAGAATGHYTMRYCGVLCP